VDKFVVNHILIFVMGSVVSICLKTVKDSQQRETPRIECYIKAKTIKSKLKNNWLILVKWVQWLAMSLIMKLRNSFSL
jgi:hypothetical protein